MLIASVIASVCFQSALAANILIYNAIPVRSVDIIYSLVAENLANNGHAVTRVTSLNNSKHTDEIIIPGVQEYFHQNVFFNVIQGNHTTAGRFRIFHNMFMKGPLEIFRQAYRESHIQNMFKGKYSFDLIITTPYDNEIPLMLADKFQIPFIYLFSTRFVPFAGENLRVPAGISGAPLMFLPYSNYMDFPQRLKNFLVYGLLSMLRHFYILPTLDQVIQEETGQKNAPLQKIEQNMSMYIMNHHWSLDYPRSYPPHIIQAGGLHCRPAQPLSKDLDKWLEDSGNAGFIFFSFGSIIKGSGMSAERIAMILDVFSSLPQRVLWKIDRSDIGTTPPNVRLEEWVSQQDVLGHPKIRVFITHGGSLSFQESIYHGVPLLVFPIEGDSPINAVKIETIGAGRSLDWNTVTKHDLEQALSQLLSDPRYKENTAARSRIMRDLPETPIAVAMFWIEYVIRHKGAPHFRLPTLSLSWLSYHLLDIYAFLLLFFIVLVKCQIYFIKFLFKRCYKRKVKSD